MIPDTSWSAAWLDQSIPEQQGTLAKAAFDAWIAGTPHVAFDAFKSLIEAIPERLERFLELGCGTGIYHSVMEHLRPSCFYCGVDISQAMIDYAQRTYGENGFFKGDAQEVRILDSHYDCVCLGSVIHHSLDWQSAIYEAYRVSQKYVILHRVVVTEEPSYEILLDAYGLKIPERILNEKEVLHYCGSLGLCLKKVERWESNASFLLEHA